jgi:hypothetical protein
VLTEEVSVKPAWSPKPCKRCGKTFTPESSGAQRYCSDECKAPPPPIEKPKQRTAIAPPPSPKAVKRNEVREILSSASRGAIAGPLELLLAAGYDASSVEVPAGLMIVVRTS